MFQLNQNRLEADGADKQELAFRTLETKSITAGGQGGPHSLETFSNVFITFSETKKNFSFVVCPEKKC